VDASRKMRQRAVGTKGLVAKSAYERMSSPDSRKSDRERGGVSDGPRVKIGQGISVIHRHIRKENTATIVEGAGGNKSE